MKHGKNTDKYVRVVLEESAKYLFSLRTPDIIQSLGQVHLNVIYDKDGPRKVKIQHSENARFLADTLFEHLSEIINTIEILDLIPTFIKTFPYKRSGMSKARYLQYHIGNYFVEIGNLNYRLKKVYLDKIKKTYGKITQNKETVEMIVKELKKRIETDFKVIIDIRDTHVHNFRYTDKELDRLLNLELLTKKNNSKEKLLLDLQSADALKKIRNKWKKVIKEKNALIEQTLDFYFETLIKIVAPKGSIIYPFNNEKS